MIKDHYSYDDSSPSVITVGWDTANYFGFVNVAPTVRLPKITLDSLGKTIDLVVTSAQVPTLELAAGDSWKTLNSEEEWGINTLVWMTLIPDLATKQWVGRLSALSNEGA